MKKWLWRPEKERGKESGERVSRGWAGGVGRGGRIGSNPQNCDVILLRPRDGAAGPPRPDGVTGAALPVRLEKAGCAGQPG